MHEMSIAAGILSAAEDLCKGRNVKKINLVIGELAGIEDECLSLCWELIREATCCSGAELNIKRTHAVLVCIDCGYSFLLHDNRTLLCPLCGGEGRLKYRASEQYIESIELYDTAES